MKQQFNTKQVLQDLYLAYLGERIPRGHDKLVPRYRGHTKWQSQFRHGHLKLINEGNTIWATHPNPKDILDSTKKIWVWSDHHFGHKNIIEYSNRPYNDIGQMKTSMIEAHNNTVEEGDIVIWCGDVSFLPALKTNSILESLTPTYKILVAGNHDMEKGKLKRMDFDEFHITYCLELEDMLLVFTHFPFKSIPSTTRKLGRTDNKPIFNFHGHTHSSRHEDGRFINVSVEAIDYTPKSLGEIYKDSLWPAVEHERI